MRKICSIRNVDEKCGMAVEDKYIILNEFYFKMVIFFQDFVIPMTNSQL